MQESGEKKVNIMYQKYRKLLTGTSLPKGQNITLVELGDLVQHFDEFLESLEESQLEKENAIISNLTELIVDFGSVPKFDHFEDRDYDSQDFPYIAENAVKCFECLKVMLPKIIQLNNSGRCHFLIRVLILCGTHNKQYFWSSKDSISACKDFQNELLKYLKYKDLHSLLCDDAFYPTIFKGILKTMRPSLLKETWMRNPSCCFVFFWILSNVKHPHLVDYIQDIFPPPFMFTSYYAIPQKVIGIRCFDHILDNIPPSLLKLDGKEDVIYHVLKPITYSRELPVIEVVFPCILKLPMMRQQKLNNAGWGEYDEVLLRLLLNVYLENNVKLRSVYLNHIISYIEIVPPFKHLKRILSVTDRHLSISDDAEELNQIACLNILKSVIRSCWPRMENHCLEILISILKLIYDLEAKREAMKKEVCDEMYNLCKECVCLLKNACSTKFQDIVTDYIQEENGLPGVELIKAVMAKDS
ncbi:TELO2-interacting protein 2-like isoform X1 [Stegodyphus dumicola]|uniref:TELO2-interacting protein 2-like isoform X1 n=1 Tax=Stegodyphus dumicola TaxID=202533 RepID=UPI0015B1530A|nr:TELO2-interacting protein 2-like isoform X1 [Stegodyphus dumicola]